MGPREARPDDRLRRGPEIQKPGKRCEFCLDSGFTRHKRVYARLDALWRVPRNDKERHYAATAAFRRIAPMRAAIFDTFWWTRVL